MRSSLCLDSILGFVHRLSSLHPFHLFECYLLWDAFSDHILLENDPYFLHYSQFSSDFVFHGRIIMKLFYTELSSLQRNVNSRKEGILFTLCCIFITLIVVLILWSQNRSISVMWELVRNADSWVLPRSTESIIWRSGRRSRNLFYKSSNWFWFILKFENHCFKTVPHIR